MVAEIIRAVSSIVLGGARTATGTKGEAMKGKLSLLVPAGVCVVLLVGGCGDSDSDTATCATDALVAPGLEAPPMWGTVDSPTPSLSWSYPDSSCNPEGYRIHLSTGPFFVDELGEETGNPSTSWSPGAPLQPGTEYAWAVQAVNGTTLGPIAGNDYFFTGPSCESNSLKAPELLAPANGADITDTVAPSLVWDYPDPCLPGAYRVDLSTSLDFDGSPLNGGTGNPSTRWGPGVSLTDCSRYYWRVAAITGIPLGPYSEVRTFRVATSPSCPADTP